MIHWSPAAGPENRHDIEDLKAKLAIAEAAVADLRREVEIYEARERMLAEERENDAGMVGRLRRILYRPKDGLPGGT